MTDNSQLSALERLTKLRDSGALSDEEFAAQKAAILVVPSTTHIRFYRRLWVVVLLTCLLLTFPLALLILATGDVYKRAKDGVLVPVSKTARYIYASLLGLWLAAIVIRTAINPASLTQDWAKSADPDKSTVASNSSITPPASQPSASPPPQSQPAESATPSPAMPSTADPDAGNAGQPDDERAYFAQREKLEAQSISAGIGTRTYDETNQNLQQLVSSMDGKTATNWICTVRDIWDLRVALSAVCFATADFRSQIQISFTDQSQMQETMYPGDVLQLSGTIKANPEADMTTITPSAITIIKKGK